LPLHRLAPGRNASGHSRIAVSLGPFGPPRFPTPFRFYAAFAIRPINLDANPEEVGKAMVGLQHIPNGQKMYFDPDGENPLMRRIGFGKSLPAHAIRIFHEQGRAIPYLLRFRAP
jgi:hypothetical protein